MLEVCDLAEVMLLQRVERRVLAQRQVNALVGLELPDVAAAQEQLLMLFEAAPTQADPEMEDLRIAMGLSR